MNAATRSPAIPGSLNVCLLTVTTCVSGWLLHLASHASTWWQVVMAIMAFSFVNNTIFSLLHESVHGIFHRNRHVNEWGGRIGAAFFPTALTFQRIFHLRHH